MTVPLHSHSRIPGAVDSSARVGVGPLSLAGCVLWLDASQITGVADGTALGTFSDLSGNGNDYTQATGATQPLYRVGSGTTLASLEFNGSRWLAAASRILPLTDFTLFAVARPGTSNTGRLFGWENSGSGTNGVALINAGSDFWVIRNAGAAGDISGLGTSIGSRWIYSPRLGTGGTANAIARVNGVQKGTSTLTAWTTGGETAHLGTSGNAASPWIGNCYEVLIYNTKLSDADNIIIETYLNNKHTIY